MSLIKFIELHISGSRVLIQIAHILMVQPLTGSTLIYLNCPQKNYIWVDEDFETVRLALAALTK
jgi:hypothetical protein